MLCYSRHIDSCVVTDTLICYAIVDRLIDVLCCNRHTDMLCYSRHIDSCVVTDILICCAIVDTLIVVL